MKKYLEYKDDKSNKFWEVTVTGNSHTVRYGKTGTGGQSKTKTFDSPETAAADAKKLIKQKIKKGYSEAAGTASIPVKNVEIKKSRAKSKAEDQVNTQSVPALVWKKTGESIPGLQHEYNDIAGPRVSNGMLAFSSKNKVMLYDISSDVWSFITSFETELNLVKFCDDRLILCREKFVKDGCLAIHDSKDGKMLFECPMPFEGIGVGLKGDDLFIAHDKGISHLDIKTSVLTDAGFVPSKHNPRFHHGMFGSYAKDVVVGEHYVYVAGRHVGVNVFRREEDNRLTFIKHIGPRYTPTTMGWLQPEKSLLLMKGEHVLIVDVKKPEKPKKFTVSFKKSNVKCGVVVDDMLYVVVCPIFQEDKMIIASIKLTPAPQLINEYKIDREKGETPQAAVMNRDHLRILFAGHAPGVFQNMGLSDDSKSRFDQALAEAQAGKNADVLAGALDLLKGLDLKDIARQIASQLEKSFKHWDQEKYNKTLLAAVNFEWAGDVSEPPDYEAMGYGYTENNKIIFSGLGGFNIDFAYKVADKYGIKLDTGAAEELRSVATHLTYQVVANAFELAVKSAPFAKLNKAASVTFSINSHDDSPIDVYCYES